MNGQAGLGRVASRPRARARPRPFRPRGAHHETCGPSAQKVSQFPGAERRKARNVPSTF